ncbi:MAG TPA: hypothetical protein VLJ57_13100 [Burkholderiaceae bacterium]|nr:hypothetical protein [Burkholderiaceae bacterium]
MNDQLGAEPALRCLSSLLARSIDYGHGHVAVVRLAYAAAAGAEIADEQWTYCNRVVRHSPDASLRFMFEKACASRQPSTNYQE